MNASGNRSGGYGRSGKRAAGMAAKSSRRVAKGNTEEAKWLAAMEVMFMVFRELLEARSRAAAGETGRSRHAAAMRKLLRYVQRRANETANIAKKKQPSGGRGLPPAK